MSGIEELLKGTNTIVNLHNQYLDLTGGRFNIFKVIGLSSEETRLHSAFLNELLDPNGSHGLKKKPLDAFIKHCLNNDFEFQSDQATSSTEYYIGPKTDTTGGRIDIIVKDNMNRAIIIENKIYACDQANQMLRYYNHSKVYKNGSRLIYLTLDGKLPSSSSTNDITEYISISYKYEIISWLTECKMFAADFPLVREALTHYINLIKQLTNTSPMDEMKDKIVDKVLETPKNLANALELVKIMTDVKIKLQIDFWEQLEQSLSLEFKLLSDEELKKSELLKVNPTLVKNYYEKRQKDLYYGLWIEVFKKDEISIYWGCEIEDNIYYGFVLTKRDEKGFSENKEFDNYKKIVQQCDNRYESTPNWLGWQYPPRKLNFREFSSNEIIELANKDYLMKVTNEIAKKASDDIKYVISKLR